MALVHEKLYQSGSLSSIDLDSYISDLCRQLGNAADAQRRGIALVTEAEPVQVDVNTAVPLGLLLNELICNSLKHAFPDGRCGRIVVRLARESDTTMLLTVWDDGIGISATVTSTFSATLGLKLIAALTAQLNGKFSLEPLQGTLANLTFPLSAQKV